MPRRKDFDQKRIEIWLKPSQIAFINKHFANDQQSAKAWIEKVVNEKMKAYRNKLAYLKM